MFKKMIATSVVALTAFAANADSNFSGFYAGLNAGYGVGSVKAETRTRAGVIVATTEAHARGFAGGVHAGYTYQMGMFLLGAEASFNFGSVKLAANSASKRKEAFGLAVRAGIDLNSWMTYIKLGWENAKFENGFSQAVITAGGVKSQRHNAFVVGLGAETVIAENFLVGMEYSVSFYGEKRTATATAIAAPVLATAGNTIDAKPRIHDVKIRLGYKF